MAVVKEEFLYRSSVGDCDIHAISWKPKKGTPRGVLQIIHGMAEYVDRYDSMARYFAEKGYAVYGNDHIGHGKSVNRKYPLGYFGENNENGATFVKDARLLTEIAKKENPEIPFILFGHSMGSFLARVYLSEYGDDLDAAIICGTGDKPSGLKIALKIADRKAKRRPAKDGALLNKLAFSSYNKKTKGYTDFDWLSTDEEVVRQYIKDPLCGFCFSNQGFRDLLTLNRHMVSDDVLVATPKSLPILFVAGTKDPVGNYGKGVKKTARLYKHADCNVKVKLYKGDRHEIHNEKNRKEVYKDLFKFMVETTEKGNKKK